MSYKYKFSYIVMIVIVGFILIQLFSSFMRLFSNSDSLSFMLIINIALTIICFSYMIYCFFYRLHVTDYGISQSLDITRITIFSIISSYKSKPYKILNDNEYPWDRVKKIEATSHWFFPCISVVFLIDSKEKRFTISPFFTDVQLIQRKIKEKIDPYFFEEDALKILKG